MKASTHWPEWAAEAFEERAAILEFDCCINRAAAELRAFFMVRGLLPEETE